MATVQTVRLLIEDSGGWWWAGVQTVMCSDGDTMGSCPVSLMTASLIEQLSFGWEMIEHATYDYSSN